MSFICEKELYDYVYPFVNNELVFDIGSNRGEVSKKFIDKGAKVLAVEPQKELFDNENYIGVFSKENICVSDKIGEITFYKGDEKHSTVSSCLKEWKLNHPNAKFTEIKIKTITLDSLIEKYGLPVYLKLDVEGWEGKILSGLHYQIPYISFDFTYGYKEIFYNCMNEIKRL